MGQTDWKLGDRVIHAGRPEWGIGEVRSAEISLQDGKRAQRVTVRFERAGVKVLSTAFAELLPAGDRQVTAEPETAPEAAAQTADLQKRLGELPEAAVDPFRTKRARLETTLGLYRFTSSGSALLDWAASQTGLRDPLSRFSRHELEQFFSRFKANLDAHLRKLVYELKKEDPAGLAAAAASAIPPAAEALRRADAFR